MNSKKILLIMFITLAIRSSLSMVGVGLFGPEANTQEISGIPFNVPGDYEEVSQPDNDNIVMDFDDMKDVETKYFGFNQSDGTSIKPNQMVISVVSDSAVELKDAEKFSYGDGDKMVCINIYGWSAYVSSDQITDIIG